MAEVGPSEAVDRAQRWVAGDLALRDVQLREVVGALLALLAAWPTVDRRDLRDVSGMPYLDQRALELVRRMEQIGVRVTRHYGES